MPRVREPSDGEPGQSGAGGQPAAGADFGAVGRGQDHALPAVAGGAPADDARGDLHHARRRATGSGTEWITISWTPASFLKRVQAGNFLEHATVYGNSYGTLKAEVLGKLRQGKDVLLNVDVQGAATIRAEGAGGPGTEAGAGVGVSDAALAEHPGSAPAPARHGFGGGHSKAAGRGAAGNRPVEAF